MRVEKAAINYFMLCVGINEIALERENILSYGTKDTGGGCRCQIGENNNDNNSSLGSVKLRNLK